MSKQSQQKRGGERKNRLFEGIKDILSAPQPIRQPKVQDQVAQGTRAFHGERDKQAKGHARNGGDDRIRLVPESSTPSRPPERGNSRQAQGAKTPPAPGLLDRMTRDGRPLLKPEAGQSQNGSPRKRKRGKTVERDLEEQRQRHISANHGTTPGRGTPHEQDRSRKNGEMREHQRVDIIEQEEKSLKKKQSGTKSHSSQSLATHAPEVVSAVRKSSKAEAGQQYDDRRIPEIGTHKMANRADIGAKTSSTPTDADKSNNEIKPSPRTVENEISEVPKTLPSPPLSKGSSPIAKRKRDEIEVVPSGDGRKKQYIHDTRLPTPEEANQKNEKPRLRKKPQPQKPAREPRAETAFASAPVAANPECKHTYKPYNHDSVPILYSAEIQHSDSPGLLNEPSPQLKVDAMLLLERGIKSKDLGRKDIPKKGRGRTNVIQDVDLYLMKDGNIYVATERGLLLGADYVKLAGIPDMTPVRFNGVKPAWVTASVARRPIRLITMTTWKDESHKHPKDKSYPDLPKGDLALLADYCVEIWERDPEQPPTWGYNDGYEHSGRAFGRRLDNKEVGWFDWQHVGDFHSLSSPWEGLYTAEDLATASAVYVPPASPITLSPAAVHHQISTLFQRTLTGSHARPLGARTSATPPASARTTSMSVQCTAPPLRKASASAVTLAPAVVAAKAPEKPKTSTTFPTKTAKTVSEQPQASCVNETVTRTIEESTKSDQPAVKTEERQPPVGQPAIKAADQPADAPEVEEAQTPTVGPSEKEPAGESEKADDAPDFNVAGKEDASSDVAAATSASITAPVCRTPYSKEVEDEIDWDDDEL